MRQQIVRVEPDRRDGEGAVPEEKRVYLEVFGCQMNKLDGELLTGALLDRGYALTDCIDRAGVVLYLTCAVRQHAEDRVYSLLGRLKARKRRTPGLVIGLLGCIAQREGDRVLRHLPHVDIVCGTAEFLRLPDIIESARAGERVLAVDPQAEVRFRRERNLGPYQAQAFVSILRGCDQRCSFCVVPSTRGPESSRPVADVVEEVRALVDRGVIEVTLLGQTVNSYGKGLAPGRRIGLHTLLAELDRIPGLSRIRFITSHPCFLGPDLIAAMADLEKVCEYLHLPVQSGSDPILRRMRRGYTSARYREAVDRCRDRIPELALATDFIVGFPGETEEDFEATRRLLEDVRFQGSFVFKYSPRPGTEAAGFLDDVPDDVKRSRNAILLEEQERISGEINAAHIGRVEEVLVEGISKNDPGRLTGRNRQNGIVVFPGTSEDGLEGKMVRVRLTGSTALTLIGERLPAEC
jgi:tRNA-2-methylthio-N6-dimethylallyladenosine synthase